MSERELYDLLLYGWLALGGVTLAALLFIAAPYGRHSRPGWGPVLGPRAGWMLMEAPAVLVPLACFAVASSVPGAGAFGLLALWLGHYVHRAFIFPQRLGQKARPMPLLVIAFGLFFNLVNGYLNGRWLSAFGPGYPASWLLDSRFLAGVALFGGGLCANLHSDAILLRLRRPGETTYRIPQGGLYRWVSSPNYLGEIVEWCGWALAAWSLPGASFALWTVANLLPRALAHHRWYRQRFPDYPQQRRALIPYLL